MVTADSTWKQNRFNLDTNWRKQTSAFVAKQISHKLECLLYKTVTTPSLTCGMKTAALEVNDFDSLRTIDMKMLRWIHGNTQLYIRKRKRYSFGIPTESTASRADNKKNAEVRVYPKMG